MRIRPETQADWEAIAVVTEAAFGSPREARMIEAIRSSDGFVPELALVAEEKGRIVGHVMLSYVEYPRFGCRPASQLGITAPDDEIPDDAFMAAELSAYDPSLRGRVAFPPAYSIDG